MGGDDSAALRELTERARDLPLPKGLDVRWLGTAGYELRFEGARLLIDPYLSRAPLRSLLLRKRALPQLAVIESALGSADDVVGVVIGHTHFDHALDAPAIALRYGCPVYGSRSLLALMHAHHLGDKAVEAKPYRPYDLGPFRVSFVPSAHSKLCLGLKVPFDGEITCGHLDCLIPTAYKCGQVWGIHVEVGGSTLYHQGSADLIDDAIRDRGIDVFLAGVAGRSFTRNYWSRILTRLQPNAVVATHFDNYFRPLDAPLGFSINVRLASVPDEVAAVSPGILVAALPFKPLAQP